MPRPTPVKRDQKEAAAKSAARAREAKAKYAPKKPAEQEAGLPVFTSAQVRKALEMAESGDGELLRLGLRDKFIFDVKRRSWYQFRGQYWKIDLEKEVRKAASRLLTGTYEREAAIVAADLTNASDKDTKTHLEYTLKKLRRRIETVNTRNRLDAVIDLAASGVDGLCIPTERWNQNPYLLQTANGVVDLTTGVSRPGSPELYINRSAPTLWQDLHFPCPTWEDALTGIFNNDLELVDYVQRILGVALIGEQLHHEFFLFVGEYRNGKGSILETVKFVLGPDLACPIRTQALLEQAFSSSSATDVELLTLQGTRIVWCSESNKRKKLDVAKVKAMTGGDTISGFFKFSNDLVNFEPQFSLFFLTNHAPKIGDDEEALWQRMRVIPFSVSFVDNPKKPHERKKDIFLKQKLRAEASGILAWLVRGCLKAQNQNIGLTPPEKVLHSTEKYHREETPLLQFIDQHCVLGEQLQVQAGPFHKAFSDWYQEVFGQKATPPSQIKLSQSLLRMGFPRSGTRNIFYNNLGLKSEEA